MGKVTKKVKLEKLKLQRSVIVLRPRVGAIKREPKSGDKKYFGMDYIRKVEKLDLNGNVAENWRVFNQNYKIFETAIELDKKTEPVKIAIFLNTIGPEAVEAFNSFGLTSLQLASYEAVKNHLMIFVVQKRTKFMKRFFFMDEFKKKMNRSIIFCWILKNWYERVDLKIMIEWLEIE